MTAIYTHEQYIHDVAELGIAMLDSKDQAIARRIKLTYGAGAGQGARGITFFGQWLKEGDAATTDEPADTSVPFVEICSYGESNLVQVAGTTLHELGHVLAGLKAAHGKEWHCACNKLGLRSQRAAGTNYLPAMFHPRIRAGIMALAEKLNDGKPVQSLNGVPMTLRPCSAGIGSRGGKSRGKGSGSRLRKWVCQCEKPVIARVASDEFDATCGKCGAGFALVV